MEGAAGKRVKDGRVDTRVTLAGRAERKEQLAVPTDPHRGGLPVPSGAVGAMTTVAGWQSHDETVIAARAAETERVGKRERERRKEGKTEKENQSIMAQRLHAMYRSGLFRRHRVQYRDGRSGSVESNSPNERLSSPSTGDCAPDRPSVRPTVRLGGGASGYTANRPTQDVKVRSLSGQLDEPRSFCAALAAAHSYDAGTMWMVTERHRRSALSAVRWWLEAGGVETAC